MNHRYCAQANLQGDSAGGITVRQSVDDHTAIDEKVPMSGAVQPQPRRWYQAPGTKQAGWTAAVAGIQADIPEELRLHQAAQSRDHMHRDVSALNTLLGNWLIKGLHRSLVLRLTHARG